MRVRVVPAFLAALFLASLLCAQAPQQAPAPPPAPPPEVPRSQQAIKQNVNLVDVLFTVFRKNKIVADLDQKNFSVFDDNAPQEIRFFSRQTDLPLRVGLLLDTSNSIRERLDFEQQAAIDFLFDVIRPAKDQAFLMTVDDDPEIIQDYTGDLNSLRDAINRQRAGGATALYDAVYEASQHLLRPPTPAGGSGPDLRRVLVVISDGDDNLSSHSRGEALEMAQRAGVVGYTISTSINWIMTDQEVNSSDMANRKYLKDEGDRVLQQFATDSGGRAFFPYHATDLAQSFHDIGNELRNQYSLGYSPSGRLADGKFHTIRISVDVKGLQVHARKGYYALPQAPPADSARKPRS